MPTEAFVGYKPHEEQKRVHRSDARFRVVVKGRQSGGTTAAVAEISNWAMSAPQRWPADKNWQFWWVTESYMTTGKARRDMEAFIPQGVIAQPTKLGFKLRNGSEIVIRSAEARASLASERLHGLVGDEFCQWAPDVWDQYLAPMLGTTEGPALFVGKPWGRNWGYDLYQRGVRHEPGYESFHWASNASPYFSSAEYERLRRELPDRVFRQEILAEFLEDGGGVFRNVDACVGPLGEALVPTVLGIDIAMTHDYCVIWAMNPNFETVYFERFNMTSWSAAKPRILEMYKAFRCQKLVIDVTGTHLGGDAISTELREQGCVVEPVQLGGENKRAVIQNLMVKFDNVAVRIPNDPIVISEFKSYEPIRLPSGYERYSAPAGKFDDTVIACALAVWGLRQYNGRPAEQPLTELQQMLKSELERARRGAGDWSGYDEAKQQIPGGLI